MLWWGACLVLAVGVWAGVRLKRWADRPDPDDGDILGWRWGEESTMASYRYQGEARDVAEVIGGEVEAADVWSAIRAVEARIGHVRPWTFTVWEAEEGAGREARGDR